ncbi:MAG TPA: acyltransferase, partial [Planctomycetota bacterium]|nr:acyltransferase [Planctomycetota bacterium]
MGSRNKGLDVLRAIAVFMTFGRHMVEPLERYHIWMPVQKVLRVWFKTGWSGVALFFVLSGFLVSSLMFNEFSNTGDIRFARFYVRRGLKIYPAFYCLLAVSILLGWLDANYIQRGLLPNGQPTTHIILSEAFFLQNYLGYIWVHVWSLAVEEHFYISLGIIIFAIMAFYPRLRYGLALRDRFKPIVWLCGIIFVACFVLRYFYVKSIPATLPMGNQESLRYSGSCYTHLRIDSLFFGVLLAYFAKFRGERFVPWVRAHSLWILAAGLLLLAPMLKYEEIDTFMLIPGYSLIYMGFGCLLLFTLYHPWKPRKEGPGKIVRAL